MKIPSRQEVTEAGNVLGTHQKRVSRATPRSFEDTSGRMQIPEEAELLSFAKTTECITL